MSERKNASESATTTNANANDPTTGGQESERDSERARELDSLRTLLPEGATVWCVLRHRSRSGMERHVSALTVVQEEGGQAWPRYLTGALVELCGYRPANNARGWDAVRVRGVGFSAPDDIAGRLSRVLYGSVGKLRGEWL